MQFLRVSAFTLLVASIGFPAAFGDLVNGVAAGGLGRVGQFAERVAARASCRLTGHRWSNGRLRATPHRVYNRSAGERLSVPFFFDPHVRTVISPLPECVQDGEEPRFQPVQFGDFLRDRLEGSYLQHQGRGGG